MPEFKDRNVEVKLMGGLASFKMSAPEGGPAGIAHQPGNTAYLEQKTRSTEDKLATLIELHQKNLISKEDFEQAKQEIIQG